MFFSDGGYDDEEEVDDGQHKNRSGGKTSKLRKEPWEDNVLRQERYHNDMMQMQRESLSTFKDVMDKIVDAFTKK